MTKKNRCHHAPERVVLTERLRLETSLPLYFVILV